MGDVGGADMLALPMAYSLGMIINSVLVVSFISERIRRGLGFGQKNFLKFLGASLLMGVAAYFSLNFLDNIFDINTFVGIFSQGVLSALIGGFVWLGVLKTLKNKELKEITNAIFAKFWEDSGYRPGTGNS